VKRAQLHGIVLAVVAAALFGASAPASKLLVESLGVFQLAGLLYLGAALGMGLPLLRERRAGARGALDARNRGRLLGAVVLGGIVGPVLLLLGLRLTLAGSVSLLLNLEMAATAVLGVALFREHLGRAGWAGVAGVVLAGIAISWGSGWPGWLAAALVAAACVCWGFDNHWMALIDRMTPARATFWKGIVAGGANLSLGLATEPFHASGAVVAAALVVGALSYGASIALYVASAQQLGATRAQAFFASAPFFGAALSFTLLAEPISSGHVVGGVLLVLSVSLLFLSQHEHEHVHAAGDHIHAHSHDDGHHLHDHPELASDTRHTHWHRHEQLVHHHPHWADIHHRHDHDHGPDDETPAH